MSRVCGDGIIFSGFSCNLIKFVEINDTMLSAVNVLVCSVIEISYGNLDIGAYEACLGEA